MRPDSLSGFEPMGHRRRQAKQECGPAAWFRFHPDLAPVAFHDLFTYRQAYASAFIFSDTVKALENLEDLGVILRFDPDAVISNREDPFITARPG
jgi:hypothetical protein